MFEKEQKKSQRIYKYSDLNETHYPAIKILKKTTEFVNSDKRNYSKLKLKK